MSDLQKAYNFKKCKHVQPKSLDKWTLDILKSRKMKLCKKPAIYGQHKGTDNTKLVVEHALTQNLKVAQPLVTIKVTRFNVLSIYFPNKPSQDGSVQTTECMISSLFAVSKVDKGAFLSQNQVKKKNVRNKKTHWERPSSRWNKY